MINRNGISAIIVFLALCAQGHAQAHFEVKSEKENFTVRRLLGELSRPWSLAFLPGGQFLITERTGSLLLVAEDKIRHIKGVPNVAATGQGGLLDAVLSPHYERDSLVYLSFSEEESGLYGVAVARGRLTGLSGPSPRLSGVETLYRAYPKSRGGLHFGSRMSFDEEGYLYITLGERGSMNRAQDPHDPCGSVLRLNPDGSIPPDNPYASDKTGGAPEVWSYGHRNAQGMARHPLTGEIWLHEHGPKGGDEVNIVKKAANYGWPKATHGINYDGSIISEITGAPGITGPVIHWTPSIAPSGLAFYDGRLFPSWSGNIFVGALAGKHLRRLELRGDTVIHQEVLLKNSVGRIRDVRTGPDGYIYFLTDSVRGALYRLEPAG
ncbi:MAG: hypothetical protein B6D68_02825 [spirochete symbiont of Stewartia floridana]|nr:MAG: hypothetical protein B6D68_02825 [spirochete symbiont of Stewartia floridana]